jgi:dihydroxy-acid dehydratase
LTLEVEEGELRQRHSAWRPRAAASPAGYARLYSDHVGQADTGCDFDFLLGARAPLERLVSY